MGSNTRGFAAGVVCILVGAAGMGHAIAQMVASPQVASPEATEQALDATVEKARVRAIEAESLFHSLQAQQFAAGARKIDAKNKALQEELDKVKAEKAALEDRCKTKDPDK